MELWGFTEAFPFHGGRGQVITASANNRTITTLNIQLVEPTVCCRESTQLGDIFHRLLVSADNDIAF